jgi:hypothetical protein
MCLITFSNNFCLATTLYIVREVGVQCLCTPLYLTASIEIYLASFEQREIFISGLVVRVPGYRSRGPGSIPGATRFSDSSGVVGLERGPLSLVEYNWGATWKKSSGSGLEKRDYGHRDASRWPRGTLYQQKLALTSPTSGGRSWTQATEFSFSVSCVRWC